MVTFEKAVVALVAGIAASPSGRFWLQFLILVALCIIGGIVLFDRYKDMAHRRAQETAEDYDKALGAKDALNDGLAGRVAALEKECRESKEREAALIKRLDTMRARHEAEIEDVKRTLGARIAELEARLSDVGCIKAPTCKKRLAPSHTAAGIVLAEGTD
jgi:hypothetical protein